MTLTEDISQWIESWNGSQGFWTAVQGVGTLLAAVAALVALFIARSQLSELIRSNRLLAASNDAMTHSNVALTRPYVVIDFDFRPYIDRSGNVRGTTIAVQVENAGRTPAKNLRMAVSPPFPMPGSESSTWRVAVAELNRVMDGETVVRSLTHVRPLTYYLDKGGDIMGTDEKEAQSWTVTATYEDAEGHNFNEDTVLELSHWRRAMLTTDPTYRIAKGVEAVAYEIKNKKLPALDFEFTTPKQGRWGRPSLRRTKQRGWR